MKKAEVLARLRRERVIALVSADVGAGLIDCARALAAGGIHSLELTMTTPAAVDALGQAAAALPDFHFGLGTVLDVDTARRAILAGASFIVTPSPRPAVITLGRRYNIPVISGAFTVEDIRLAQAAGGAAAKVFPGELFGPAYLQQLKSTLPEAALIPIGGVTPGTIAEFLRVGVLAAFAGRALASEERLAAGDWPGITARAREFAAAVAAFAAEPAPAGAASPAQ